MRKSVFVTLLLLTGSVSAAAQGGYAHLQVVDGDVTVRRSASPSSSVAIPDQSLGAGDVVTTGRGRAEIGLPDGSTLWLDESTTVALLAVGTPAAISVEIGSAAVGSSRSNGDFAGGEPLVRLETVAALIGIGDATQVRIQVQPSGYTQVICEAGSVELIARDDLVRLRSGQRSSAYPGESPESAWTASLASDDFDRFVATRLASDGSAEFHDGPAELPQPVRSYDQELRSNGRWVYLRDRSAWVWQPRVGNDWRPYSTGQWESSRDGLVWVSVEPWGYVTHHYGAWDWTPTFGWYWFPGDIYAPAWVDWYEVDGYTAWCPRRSYSYRDHHGRSHHIDRDFHDRDFHDRDFNDRGEHDRRDRHVNYIDRGRVAERPLRTARATRAPAEIGALRSDADSGDRRREGHRIAVPRGTLGSREVERSRETPPAARGNRTDAERSESSRPVSAPHRAVDTRGRREVSASPELGGQPWWRRVDETERRSRSVGSGRRETAAPSPPSPVQPDRSDRATSRSAVTRVDPTRSSSSRLGDVLMRFRETPVDAPDQRHSQSDHHRATPRATIHSDTTSERGDRETARGERSQRTSPSRSRSSTSSTEKSRSSGEGRAKRTRGR